MSRLLYEISLILYNNKKANTITTAPWSVLQCP